MTHSGAHEAGVRPSGGEPTDSLPFFPITTYHTLENALGLRVVGDRAVDATEYAIAYPRDGVSENTLAFVTYVADMRTHL